jgi:antirestriction protein ArdC
VKYSKLCEHITTTIIDAIESGDTGSWSAPWHRISAGWAPRNAKTDNFYGGSNVINLAVAALDRAETNPCEVVSPVWATYKQWADLGAQVRKGERSTPIIKWVPKSKKTRDDDTPPPTTRNGQAMTRLGRPQLIPKVYGVFNAAQVDGWTLPEPVELAEHEPIEAAEQWITGSGANVAYGFDHASYSLVGDRIEVPGIGQYENRLDHYSTVCHELIHWTSTTARCDRQLGKRFGDDAYGFEELIAELGAAFTTARLGLTNTPRVDHVAYLGHWLRILKADSRALFAAASQAQKAVDFIADLVHPADINDVVALAVVS